MEIVTALETAIGTVGFPIAAFLLLWNFSTKSVGALTEAMNSLKSVVEALDTKIDTQIELTRQLRDQTMDIRKENKQ